MSGPFNGKTILVVDDDPDIVVAIQTALQDTGAKVCTAADGDEAVTLAASDQPDLVVLDAMLPKRSGFLVMDKLKRSDGTKPSVIMITGNGGNRHKEWAESRGVDGYLSKPFRMERLLEFAEKLLVTDKV